MATTKLDYGSDHKHQFEPMPDIDEDMKYEVPPLNIDPNAKVDENRKRRFSVSAESTDDKKAAKFVKKVYPKSKEALDRIKQSTQDVFLFEGLDMEQSNLLIDAMFEKKCKKGEEIISQGDHGDYFYVIESGVYEVWKSDNKKAPQMNAKKVFQYKHKGAFGELALMYNAPRAATVKSVTNGILWAVDRLTFRHIIVGCTDRKRKKYDAFLKEVQLLLNSSEELRASIADILESQIFHKGEYVMRQGADAEHFYFIQSGTAVVTLNNKKKVVRKLHAGDFFGERALLMNDPRSANVIVDSETLEICGMDKAGFMRLLSVMYDKFRAGFKDYELDDISYGDNDQEDDGNISEIE
eukprot:CAMPEP_0197028810 /NCGR_PEP_ID=MMETSP1384-20130603/8412_1 /TAXON_ID=29189 /ORGANISM="Ammonia sp." /LENGTH=352 /DNA_ID=CAMNT_0042457869 /DNA_START=65 /DNA_END=1123 /DNA_ORIENTATION=+